MQAIDGSRREVAGIRRRRSFASSSIPRDWLEDRAPDDVSQSHREEVERSVETVLESNLPRLSALAGATT
jgi:hypothetical protein